MAVGVASDGSSGANVPGPDPNADGEVMLDIEVAGAVAPKATIAVYFALNTDNGFLAALNAALHDNVRQPSVISISWGSAEDFNTKQALNAFDQALQDAATLGVTVCCSSRRRRLVGPRERESRRPPARRLSRLEPVRARLRRHEAARRRRDHHQRGRLEPGQRRHRRRRQQPIRAAGVPGEGEGSASRRRATAGRGVPDVAGDADPRTGYQVRLVGGQRSVIGGTSAVAPLWAGLVALLNQQLATRASRRSGFLNPLIYGLPATTAAFHDITQGNNDIEGLGKYQAGPGWDACTGLGSPDGAKLIAALAA